MTAPSFSDTSRGLQWGRTLSSAEVCAPVDNRKLGRSRFNGAALFQVRKFVGQRGDVFFQRVLQWGRTLSSAEVTALGDPTPKSGDASMGPHSFKCGS